LVIFIFFFISPLSLCWVNGWDNGLARTPPMGWNSWNHFGCNTSEINQDLFKETAKAMVDSGLKAAGYEYINLDDCWLAKTRDSQGRLQPDPARFPDGIKALADYVHSLGLKFGIYEDTANLTCMGYPGSAGHYALDVQTFAEWGVDYVKLDGCYTNVADMKAIYTNVSESINKTGRPMVFSCSWPAYANLQGYTVPYDYLGTICNLWRYWYDIDDQFDSWTDTLDYTQANNLSLYAAPGHWNDPDMLEVGNGNETATEYRSLMSMWAIIAAPLIAGNDLRNMTKETIAILTAPEVIAVDQDPLGKQGTRVNKTELQEVWVRELSDGSLAVALFNRDEEVAPIAVYWDDIGFSAKQLANVRDLWLQRDLGPFSGAFADKVDGHGVTLVKITKVN